MDNEEFQKTQGVKDARKLNRSFYDANASSSDPPHPAGEWNCHLSFFKVASAVAESQIRWETSGRGCFNTANKIFSLV